MSESVAAHRVATMPSPMLSWALLPFRALPSTAVSVLWTPRQAPVSSTASCAFLENRADLVPKHPARRGLVRTDLSWTFLLRFTDADGILRIVGPSSRDLPAVEVAFSPLVLHIASPKLGLAISPSSRWSSAEAPCPRPSRRARDMLHSVCEFTEVSSSTCQTTEVFQRERCRLHPPPPCRNTLALACCLCRTADPLGVCDVKDRVELTTEATHSGTRAIGTSPGLPVPPISIAGPVPTLRCRDV